MKHRNSWWLPFHGGHPLPPGISPGADPVNDHPGEDEPSPTGAAGDIAEGAPSNWESAWIDLGGEG